MKVRLLPLALAVVLQVARSQAQTVYCDVCGGGDVLLPSETLLVTAELHASPEFSLLNIPLEANLACRDLSLLKTNLIVTANQCSAFQVAVEKAGVYVCFATM